MSTSPLLAECISFKSQQSGKFVSYVREYQGIKKILQVSGENTQTPYTRFQAEPSKTHDGHYHIKSLYNDKYWVAKEEKNGPYIFVDADTSEEEISKPSCTLFRIELHSHECEIFHAHTSGGVSIVPFSDSSENTAEGCLLVGNGNKGGSAFKLISMLSRVILPENVCFKGDNNQYLRVKPVVRLPLVVPGTLGGHSEKHAFMQFSASDMNDSGVIHSIVTNEDGTIRIRNKKMDKYWRMEGWVYADSSDTTSNNRNTLFLPEIVDDNWVALKSLGNNKYCARLTDYWENCLNSCADSAAKEARLTVEEPLISRKISVVEYHLEDAKVISEEVILMDNIVDVNSTSTPRELAYPIEYTVTEERRWESSTTWKFGGHVTISGELPKILGGLKAEVQVEGGLQKSQNWGTHHTDEIKRTYNFKGILLPNKKIKTRLMMSKLKCHVPFSYVKKDVQADGKSVSTTLHDGIFYGVNCINVYHEATEEDL